MNLPGAIFVMRWLIWDTFRQALASRTFWLMLIVSGLCILLCLSVSVEGGETLRQPGGIELSKAGEPLQAPTNLGVLKLGFGAIRLDLPRDASGEPRAAAIHFLQTLLALWVAGTIGILAAVIWTAGFMPAFLEPAAAPVLLTKPVPRWMLVAGKFLGVLVFVAFQTIVFFGGTWMALGFRTGVWGISYMLCIPLLLIHFTIIYGFSALLAVSTRSTVTCIFGSILFWFACYAMNYGRHTMWAFERGRHGRTTAVAFHHDRRFLASGFQDGTITNWDLPSGEPIRSFAGHAQAIRGLDFSPDGKLLASSSDDGIIRIRDAVSGQEQNVFPKSNREAGQVIFRPGDGMSLIWGSKESAEKKGQVEVTLKEASTGREILTLKGHTGRVTSLAFHADEQVLATGSADKNVMVWDAKDGQVLRLLRGHKELVTCVAFRPGSPMLASGSADHSVRIWDLTTGQMVLLLSKHTETVLGVAYSPDGNWLASASPDETIIVWDANTGQILHTLLGAGNQVAFSLDSQRLASAGADGSVKIWDASSGRLYQSLPRPFPQTRLDHFVEVGYWILPKPGDINILLDQTLEAKDHFEALPESFRKVETAGALQPELSILASLLFTLAMVAVAARQLAIDEY